MVVAHRWLKPFRALHLYFGVFTAPALLFLALTGGLQSVNLHEPSRGSGYTPPAWLASMAHMHKKQSFEVPARRPAPRMSAERAGIVPSANAATRTHDKPLPAAPKRNPWPMKIFFVLVSLSLVLSTLTGICMGWRYSRNRRRYGAALAAGVLVPALLLLI
jgi:hypothetical protein